MTINLESALEETPTITTNVEYVTPQLARDWLATMTRNRPLSDSWRNILSREIKEGRFVFTHQAVAFDATGALFDGQHRLSAIVAADKGIYLLVVRGVPSNAMLATDTGHRRSLSQIAYLSGIEEDKQVVEIATFLCQREHGVISPSMIQLRYVLVAYAERILNAKKIMPRKLTYGSVPLQAAMTRAIGHAEESRLKQFVALLPDPTTDDAEDSGVIQLHKYLKRVQAAHARVDRTTLYTLAISALYAFANRQHIKRLVLTGTNMFPVVAVPELDEQEDDDDNGNEGD